MIIDEYDCFNSNYILFMIGCGWKSLVLADTVYSSLWIAYFLDRSTDFVGLQGL